MNVKNLGASFSHRHLEELGLDVDKALEEFTRLGLKWIRLGCYWDELEPEKGKYDLKQMDKLIKRAKKLSLKIVLTVGMKAPRYPEYYLPGWIKTEPRKFGKIDLNNKELSKNILQFIEKCVKRYRKYVNVWQVENEPLDPSGPKHWRISKDLLNKEVDLVRELDPEKKIIVNLWGNELSLRRHCKSTVEIADIVGCDIYLRRPVPGLKRLNKYIGPLHTKSTVKKIFKDTRASNKEVWLAELQAEPWEPDEIVTKKKNPPSFLPEHLKTNLKYGQDLGVNVILLWGFEYWYLRKSLGDNRYWNAAKDMFKKRL